MGVLAAVVALQKLISFLAAQVLRAPAILAPNLTVAGSKFGV